VKGRVENSTSQKVVLAVGGGLLLSLNKAFRTNLIIDYGFRLNGWRGRSLNLGEVF